MATFGFIGTGNMGGILARAVCRSFPAEQVILANRSAEKAAALAKELGCKAADNETVAETAELIFLGVKPQMMEEMLAGIAPVLSAREDRFVLVSMAAGLTIDRIRQMAGGDYPVIRMMPNTPSAVGEGMILYTSSEQVASAEEELFLDAFSSVGRLSAVPEKLMDAGSAVMGCGVAFMSLIIEGMADGAVACGLPRAQALEFAAQMAAGTGKLMLGSEQHPGIIKDICCSPGGTSIQGIRVLENAGVRGAMMEAVIAAYERSLELN